MLFISIINTSQYEKALGGRSCLSGSAAEIEEQFNALGAMVAAQSPPPDPTVDTRDETADSVPVRIYKPQGHEGKKLPIGVYYHGGGYVLGSLDSEDGWCRYIAKNTPCVIVSVGYRLGPTHKLPVMLNDSIAAYKWVC
jgi:versiconal hemiacetal acetate esterase